MVTSDVRQQIMLINRKAREEWEKKHAEAEKLQRLNEVSISCLYYLVDYSMLFDYLKALLLLICLVLQPESNPGVDGEKEKDEGRVKPVKVPRLIHHQPSSAQCFLPVTISTLCAFAGKQGRR